MYCSGVLNEQILPFLGENFSLIDEDFYLFIGHTPAQANSHSESVLLLVTFTRTTHFLVQQTGHIFVLNHFPSQI